MKKLSQNNEVAEVVDVSELHGIITGLKLSESSFSSVMEPEAYDVVRQMIKDLPGPEKLYALTGTPEAITYIKDQIGEIMTIINDYGTRTVEYRERHKSKKGLPPRYPVVEMRPMQNAAKTIKAFVKVSEIADNKGNSKIASSMIQYARQKELSFDDICKMHKELEKYGMTDEIEILRQAGLWDKLKKMPEEMRTKKMDNRLYKILDDLNKFGLLIEKWLRKYPDNTMLQEVYQKMHQMHYMGQEVFNMFDEDLNKNVETGESFRDDQQVQVDDYVGDLDLEKSREKANRVNPTSQAPTSPEQPVTNEVTQSLLQSEKQLITDVINFLMAGNNANRVLDSFGDMAAKNEINSMAGSTISEKLLNWLGKHSNPEQAVENLYNDNVILRTQLY